MLIKRGADVNAADRYKETPLHLLINKDSPYFLNARDDWTEDDILSKFSFSFVAQQLIDSIKKKLSFFNTRTCRALDKTWCGCACNGFTRFDSI